MRRASTLIAVLAGLSVSSVAQADIQKYGSEEFPGKMELSAHIGAQSGLVGYNGGGTPGGFKFLADFSYHIESRFNGLLWLNAGVNFVLGGGGCTLQGACGFGAGGDTAEPHAGIKLKWKTPIPLVPYMKADVVFIGIFARFCGDNGFSPGAAVGGGAKYFLTKNIGVGLETNFTFGPAFYGGTNGCPDGAYPSHTEFYLSFDIGAGGEFIF
jgi:hypothetical protein